MAYNSFYVRIICSALHLAATVQLFIVCNTSSGRLPCTCVKYNNFKELCTFILRSSYIIRRAFVFFFCKFLALRAFAVLLQIFHLCSLSSNATQSLLDMLVLLNSVRRFCLRKPTEMQTQLFFCRHARTLQNIGCDTLLFFLLVGSDGFSSFRRGCMSKATFYRLAECCTTSPLGIWLLFFALKL